MEIKSTSTLTRIPSFKNAGSTSRTTAWQVLPAAREGNAELQGFIIAGKDRRWYPAKAQNKKVDGKWTLAVWSDLVEDPVAVRYGWANWPTGNLVGRERLPLETFRTDDWPIPEGVSYSNEAKKAASDNLKELRTTAQKQALDRKIRQMLIDLPKAEAELHKGNLEGQVKSKISRIETILEELLDAKSTGRQLQKENPELLEKLEKLKKQVQAL